MTPEEERLLQERARSQQDEYMQELLKLNKEQEQKEQQDAEASAQQQYRDLGPKLASQYAGNREEKEPSAVSQVLENAQNTFALEPGQMEFQEKWMEENIYIPLLDMLDPNRNAEQVAADRARLRKEQSFEGRDLQKEFSDKVLEVGEEGNALEKLFYGTASNVDALKTGATQGIFLGIPALLDAAIDLSQGKSTRKTYYEMPEYAKNSFVARLLYDSGRTVFSPWGRLTGGKTKLGRFVRQKVTEGIVETATQNDVDDYFLSRSFAEQMGNLVNSQGGDGEEFTRRILEGDGLGYNAANTAARFLYNVSQAQIADTALYYIKGLIKPSRQAIKVAKDTKQDVAKVKVEENTKVKSRVDTDADPIDTTNPDYGVVDVDVQNGVSVRGAQLAVRANPVDPDNVGTDGPFFLNTRIYTEDDPTYEASIQFLTQNYERVFPNAEIAADAAYKAMDFLKRYKGVLDQPTKEMVEDFFERFSERANIEDFAKGKASSVKMWMVKNAMFDPSGAAAGAIVMRELNQRLVREAARFDTLFHAEGGDLTPILLQIRDIVNSGETWANVNRIRQQAWNVGGTAVQRARLNRINELLDSGTSLTKTAKKVSKEYDRKVTPQEIAAVRMSSEGGEATFSKLINEAIEGNAESLEKVKNILSYISTQDPDAVLDFGTLSSKEMGQKFFEGTVRDVTRGYYTINLLGQLRTASTAIAGSITKSLENNPLILPGKFLTKLQTDPKNAFKLQDYTDFMSTIQGQVTHVNQSWRVTKRTWGVNKPITDNATKLGKQAKNLEEMNTELKGRYQQYVRTLDEEGVPESSPQRIHAWFAYQSRSKILNNPFLTVTSRIMLAGDEAFKTNAAMGVAQMLTQRRIVAEGLEPKEADRVFDEVLKRMFKDGDPTKGFRQTTEAEEAIEFGRYMTFQRRIPGSTGPLFNITKGQGRGIRASGFVAGALRGAEQAAEESAAWRWAAPFARMSWDFLNQVGSVGVGIVPGGPALAKLIDPDVRDVLEGRKGIMAKQNLENSFATGMTAFYSIAGLTWAGHLALTPVMSKRGEQSLSLIITDPINPEQKYEMDINKLGPLAFPIGMAVGITQEFRNGRISEGDYQEGIQNLLITAAKLTLDQTFLTGLMDATAILNVRDFNQYTISNIGKMLGSVTGVGLFRMLGDFKEGYRYPTYVEGDLVGNFLRGWASRSGFDLFIPKPTPFTNIYTGKLDKTAVLPDDPDFKDRVVSGVLGQFSPYRIQPRTVDDPVASKSLQYYETDNKYLTTIGSGDKKIPLESLEQQSALSDDIFNPEFGDLRGRLKALFKTKKFRAAEKRYEKLRAQNNDGLLPRQETVGRASEAEVKAELESYVRLVHRQAKDAALEKGRLREWYREKKIQLETPVESSNYNGATDGLYAYAAQQDTQLASQVREILDLT